MIIQDLDPETTRLRETVCIDVEGRAGGHGLDGRRKKMGVVRSGNCRKVSQAVPGPGSQADPGRPILIERHPDAIPEKGSVYDVSRPDSVSVLYPFQAVLFSLIKYRNLQYKTYLG